MATRDEAEGPLKGDGARRIIWSLILAMSVGAVLWGWRTHQRVLRHQARHESDALQSRIVEAERKVRANPEDAAARIELGGLYDGTGDTNAAVAEFRAAVRLSPYQAGAYIYLGHAYGKRGDALDAEKAFRRAIELAPQAVEGYVGLASSFYVRSRNDEAAAALRKAVAWCPPTPETYVAVGDACLQTLHPKLAVQNYRQALHLDPDSALAHFGLGRALTELAEWQEAAAELETAIGLGLGTPAAHYFAGLSYLRGQSTPENRQKAREHLTKAIKLDPRAARAHHVLGQVAAREGDDEEALRHYEKAVELAPDIAEPHHDLSQLYRRMGQEEEAEREMALFRKIFDHDKALERLLRGIIERPQHADAYLALARFYLEDQQYPPATTALQTAETLAPDSAEVHSLLRQVYELTGRTEDAREQAKVLAELEADA
ncbi:MAG: tetratricopeptide repeat protein [Armatimonadota bacterium]